jgi:hypothetical protein
MLSSLCSDILEEVMDTTSEQFIRACNAISHKKENVRKNLALFQNEGCFLEQQWV